MSSLSGTRHSPVFRLLHARRRDKVRIGLPAWRIDDPPPPPPPPLLEQNSPDEILISLLVQRDPVKITSRVGSPLLSCPSGTFRRLGKTVLRVSFADLQTFFLGFCHAREPKLLSRTLRTVTAVFFIFLFLFLSLFPAVGEGAGVLIFIILF